jgi:hypothetical protein
LQEFVHSDAPGHGYRKYGQQRLPDLRDGSDRDDDAGEHRAEREADGILQFVDPSDDGHGVIERRALHDERL